MIAIKDMEMPSCCMKCTMLVEECGYLYCCITSNSPRDYEQKIMEDCPLVEIEERKVGKWIYDKTSQNWRCSECNETPKTLGYVGTADFMEKEFAFCNHCGADMRGRKDN